MLAGQHQVHGMTMGMPGLFTLPPWNSCSQITYCRIADLSAAMHAETLVRRRRSAATTRLISKRTNWTETI